MPTESTEMLFKKLVLNIQREYRNLLSAGVSDIDAEQIILTHFSELVEPGTPQEGYMWLAFALYQWELGRLSPSMKTKACHWLATPNMMLSPEVETSMRSKLYSPMPPKKKIRRSSSISHCPWPVGSLLAYRIISATHPQVTQSPYFGKYVLLRIIQITRHPVSSLAPDLLYNESMLVGLYNWIGDEIPDPEIVNTLSFTPISIREPTLNSSILKSLPIPQTDKVMQQVIQRTTTPRIETCCNLSWKCAKGIRRDDVFTFMACDTNFQSKLSPFFKTGVTDCSINHSIPFDFDLVNRFAQLTHNSD